MTPSAFVLEPIPFVTPPLERVTEGQLWIQEQAPAGNFFDSVGFPVGMTPAEATEKLRSWQKSFPSRVCRLISRSDTFVVA